MRVRITITESGGGQFAETLISERVIEMPAQKQLTAKGAAQILASEHPELGLLAKAVVKTDKGWTVSKSTDPLCKYGHQFVWRHFYVAPVRNQAPTAQ